MKKYLYFIFAILLMASCDTKDFDIDNTNSPDKTKTDETPEAFRLVSVTNHENLAYAQVNLSSVFYRLMSDQMTSTNNYLGFWWFSDEPRRQMTNTTNNEYLAYHAGGAWSTYNSVNISTNNIIKAVEVDGFVFDIDGIDLTQQELAGAYFDKALALGYISYIYDKGYVVNHDTDVSNIEFSAYNEILEASLENFQTAITTAEGFGSDFKYEVNGVMIDLTLFKQLANSYMARFAIGVARTDAEAQTLDYTKIMQYANNAITSNYFPLSIQNQFFNNYQDWSLYVLGAGAGYLPSDIKIQHLFNPTGYPDTYPTDTTILPTVVSTDPRTSYYEYVGSEFGYLNADRGRHLFSSYRHVRYWDWNNENQTGIPVELIPKAEMDYIKAECKYRMSDYAGAVTILNSTPRSTVGLQTTTPAKDNVRNALLYEYSIELDLACGAAVNWSFMRRHDFLQKGTPTSYPIPANELEIIGEPLYTFGSESRALDPGTAEGQNDWKTINLVY